MKSFSLSLVNKRSFENILCNKRLTIFCKPEQSQKLHTIVDKQVAVIVLLYTDLMYISQHNTA